MSDHYTVCICCNNCMSADECLMEHNRECDCECSTHCKPHASIHCNLDNLYTNRHMRSGDDTMLDTCPVAKMKRNVPEGAQPVALVLCGSFSPITTAHLRMLEDARDALAQRGMFVTLGIASPVHDGYGKPSLVEAKHRVAMAKLATIDSDWIDTWSWECAQPGWTRTAAVIQKYSEILNKIPVQYGDCVQPVTGIIRTMLLCGSDVLESFTFTNPDGTPVWSTQDRDTLIGDPKFGVVSLERGIHPESRLAVSPYVSNNITSIPPVVEVELAVSHNSSSSTVRALLRNGKSIRYLVDTNVVKYIEKHQLYIHKLCIHDSQRQ